MSAFSDAIGVLLDDDNLAEDVTYTPSAGTPASIRAIFSMADEVTNFGDGQFLGPRIVATVKASDVAAPAKDDTIERADGTTYTVRAHLTDALRLSHKLHLKST
jgi:hypothetical protein